MKAIIVDDEPLMMKRFSRFAADIPDLTIVGQFESAEKALAFAAENPFEAAFLDLSLKNRNSITNKWKDLSDSQLYKLDSQALTSENCCGSLLLNDALISKTVDGDALLYYDEILWVYLKKTTYKAYGIIKTGENNKIVVHDRQGMMYEIMDQSLDKFDSERMLQTLLKRMRTAGYYPVVGYEANLYVETTKKNLEPLMMLYKKQNNQNNHN